MPFNSAVPGLRELVRAGVRPVTGVYTLFDAAGLALYVGKSVNLRSRLLTHLHTGTGIDNPRRHLAFAVAGFAVRETEGELLALLLEDALIKALAPRENTRQRDYREYCYLAFTGSPPTLRVVESVDRRPVGTWFGPYRDRFAARAVVDLVRECFRDAPPGDVATVERITAFLGGDDGGVGADLAQRIEQEAARLRFEEAARLKATRDFCDRYARRRRFIRDFASGHTCVSEGDLAYRFDEGALVSLRSATRVLEVPDELREAPADARFQFDRANVVYDWMRRR